jgi:hypothetical protein
MVQINQNYVEDALMRTYVGPSNTDPNVHPSATYQKQCLEVDYQVEDSQVIINSVHSLGCDDASEFSAVNRRAIALHIEDRSVFGY